MCLYGLDNALRTEVGRQLLQPGEETVSPLLRQRIGENLLKLVKDEHRSIDQIVDGNAGIAELQPGI